MRALAWPDAFPAADVGVMKALGVATPRAAIAAAELWRPWREPRLQERERQPRWQEPRCEI
jgi:3-methyladenine DNA glycosylase/8-oxoguanine DNA glycosylase